MADETYRVERRPITASETEAARPPQQQAPEATPQQPQAAPSQSAAAGQVASDAAARVKAAGGFQSPDALEDAGAAPMQVTGNLPPFFKAMRQEVRNDAISDQPAVPSMSRGSKGRRPAPVAAPVDRNEGTDVVTDKSKLLNELIQRVQNQHLEHETIVLPSMGRFYDGEDGPADGVIHIRPMTGDEEQILATPRYVKRGQALRMIFSKCIQEKFNSDKFLSDDRTCLLVFLRAISYGTSYEVEVKCPSCERKFQYDINLDELHIDPCPEDFNHDSLTGTLPVSGFDFRYRLSTGEDEQVVQAYRERRNKGFDLTGQADDTLTYRTALLIEDLQGLTAKHEIQKLLKVLPGEDLAVLRTAANEPPFGMQKKVEILCPQCYSEFEIDLPLESNFFFPRAKQREKTQA